jgi:hypothetical protein
MIGGIMGMPALIRGRYPERQDCWHVYYGGVQVRTIARRSGRPVGVEQWEWRAAVSIQA